MAKINDLSGEYLDSTAILHGNKKLSTILNNLKNITFNYNADNIEWFKNFCITSNVPTGISLWNLYFNGNNSMAIVIKASFQYLSFIQFGYSVTAIQYRYLVGTWYTNDL